MKTFTKDVLQSLDDNYHIMGKCIPAYLMIYRETNASVNLTIWKYSSQIRKVLVKIIVFL